MPLVHTRKTQSMHSRNSSNANRNNAENYFKMPLVSTRVMTCMLGLPTNSSGLIASWSKHLLHLTSVRDSSRPEGEYFGSINFTSHPFILHREIFEELTLILHLSDPFFCLYKAFVLVTVFSSRRNLDFCPKDTPKRVFRNPISPHSFLQERCRWLPWPRWVKTFWVIGNILFLFFPFFLATGVYLAESVHLAI